MSTTGLHFGTSGVGATSGSITVREEDGTPNVSNVTELRVSNATLTDNGSGSVSFTNSSGAIGRFDSALGSVTSPQTVNHALGSRPATIVIDDSTGIEVEVDIDHTDVNNISISGWSGSRNLRVLCVG